MAGDWIKMRCNLWTHPKVVRIASALSVTRCAVIGALHGAWSVFDQHCDDDSGLHMTHDELDALIETPGMCSAMMSVGWMTEDNGSLYLPRYEEHNGSTGKRRASESKRKQASRSRPQNVRISADMMRTREEKRREEKNNNPKPQRGVVKVDDINFPEGMDTPEVKAAMGDWLQHKREIGSTYKSATGPTRLVQKWLMSGPESFVAAVNHSISMNYKGVYNGSGNGSSDGRSTAQRQQDDNFDAIRDFVRRSELREVDGDALPAEENHIADDRPNGSVAQSSRGLPSPDD